METLRTSKGYESLKTKYMRQLARSFPELQREPAKLDNTLVGDMDTYTIDNEEYGSAVNIGILPINPIAEKKKPNRLRS